MHVSTLLLASTTLLAILPAQQQPGPAIDVEQTIYTASFSANGAEYRAATAEVGPPPQLRLRYLSAGRSHGNLLSRVVDAVPERRTNRRHDDVHFHHGTVTEQYRIDGVGFEQSFEFEQRPDGSGDLVIAIEVSGNVRAEACEPQHRDLHFRTDQGGTIRYGEAIAFDRRGERIEVQTAYDGAGTIRLVVPADFVDRAAYPLVVDPTVGVALSLSTFGPSRYPDLAFDVGSQRHLVAWLSSSGSTRTLRATLVSSDGVFTLSLNNIASGSPGPFAPAVASCRCVNGNAFLIVWQQSGQIRGRLIDADTGSPRAAEFVIDNPSGGDTCRRPTVSSADGIGMIVAWDRTFSGELLPRTIRSRELYWANAATAANVSIGPQRTLRTVTSTSGYVQSARLARSSHARWVSGGYQAHCRLVWERFYLSPAPGDYDIVHADGVTGPGRQSNRQQRVRGRHRIARVDLLQSERPDLPDRLPIGRRRVCIALRRHGRRWQPVPGAGNGAARESAAGRHRHVRVHRRLHADCYPGRHNGSGFRCPRAAGRHGGDQSRTGRRFT